MGAQQAATVAHRPPHTEENVGHLLSNLATRLRLGTPRINTFSGDAMSGKTDISFKQWDHELQCIKDHYLELVVQESTVRSLKGVVADMAGDIGPSTSMTHILQKLAVIFGTVVAFNILMQNFYKVTKGWLDDLGDQPLGCHWCCCWCLLGWNLWTWHGCFLHMDPVSPQNTFGCFNHIGIGGLSFLEHLSWNGPLLG